MTKFLVAWRIEGVTEIDAQTPAEADLKHAQINSRDLAETGERETDEAKTPEQIHAGLAELIGVAQ